MKWFKVLSTEGQWKLTAESEITEGQVYREYHSYEGLVSDSGYTETVLSAREIAQEGSQETKSKVVLSNVNVNASLVGNVYWLEKNAPL